MRLSQDSLGKIRTGGHTRVKGKMGWEPGRCSRVAFWNTPLPPKAQSALLLRGLLLTRGWGHVLYLSVSKFCTEGMFLGD